MKTRTFAMLTGAVLIACFSLHATEDRLINAAQRGSLKEVQKYIYEGISQETSDKSGRSLIMIAAAFGRMDIVEYLITNSANVNKMDYKGNTLLHILADIPYPKAVQGMQSAIRAGANVYVKNYDGQSPAVRAINAGNTAGFKSLLDGKYNKNEREQGMPVIMYAYAKWQKPIVKMLAEAGTVLSETNSDGETVLHVAAQRNDTDVAASLLNADRNIINLKTRAGKTPLMIAVEKGNLPFAELMLKTGADVNLTDMKRRGVLHYCALLFRAERIAKSFPDGLNYNAKDSEEKTPLLIAAESGRWENVEYFSKKGADLNARDSAGKTPLLIAAEKGGLASVKMLIDAGADVKTGDRSGATLLHHLAGIRGKAASQLIPLIIAKGGDINARSQTGATPIGKAVSSGNGEAFFILLQAGADKNGMELNAVPLPMFAYEKYQKELSRKLIEGGADVNKRSSAGQTILYSAATANDTTFMNFLFTFNPELNIKDSAGKTPLMAALDKNSILAAVVLLDKGADVNIADGQGKSVLHYLASAAGATGLLNKIRWAESKVAIDAKDSMGRTPLAIAVGSNRTDNVEFLLNNGADPNGTDHNGVKLIFVAYGTNRNMLNLFIAKGARTDVRMADGKTLLLLSIEKNDTPLLKMLVERGTDLNEKQANGRYPLELAIDKYQYQNAKLLLDNNASIAVKDQKGNPLLALAVEKRSGEIVRMLLEKGADPKDKNIEGKPILIKSFEANDAGIFKQLLDKGADGNVRDAGGTPVICSASEKNGQLFVKYLIDGKADVNAADPQNSTALILSSWKGNYNIVKMLLEIGAAAERKNKDGDTAVFKAVEAPWNAGPIIELLSKNGADVKAVNDAGDSLLHRCAEKKRFDLFDQVLKLGADPNVRNNKDETLLMSLSHIEPPTGKGSALQKQTAENRESLRLIQSLIKSGADPNAVNKYGQSALNMARVKRNIAIVTALLGGGAQVNLQDKYGNTVLKKEVMDYIGNYRMMDSLKEASQKMIDLFLSSGGDINVKDKFGRTALSHALKEISSKNEKKVLDIVPYLVSKGAKTDIKDNDGLSSLDYARRSGNSQLIEILR